ncbi:MAG: Ig-like domain-containing protein [Ferruginibacter sp.]|nr:Ig-like domain-containing protein [Ferruginibacter sp.]
MKSPSFILSFFIITFFVIASLFSGGCAQIGIPAGGAKDTLAPVLIKASPAERSRNVTSNKITLEFDEYIDVTDLQQNLVISPLQNRNPSIIASPRSITLKFRDTLLPNTTYNINFGNAVRDINENNVLKNLTYVFSTGITLDSLTLSGSVTLAETGEFDSTIIVLLYRNAVDSTVQKKKPNYVAKVNSDGSFNFTNLPADNFKIYALKDGDGGKTYNSLSETFAFTEEDVSATDSDAITLFAYAESNTPANQTSITALPVKKVLEKKLRVTNNIQGSKDLLEPLELTFSNPLKILDTNKIYIVDTFFKRIPAVKYKQDSTATQLTITTKWQPDVPLILIIDKDAAEDSAGTKLAKTDTIRFTTKRNEDYGKLVLRFNNIDLTKNPVIQFVVGNNVKYAYPILSAEFMNNMFTPGEYGVRILYDKDKNGKWTPGNYLKKLQPEIVVALPQKLNVKADWDNEREINL